MTTAVKTRKVSQCGDPAGYKRHYRQGTPVCEPCRIARNARDRKDYGAEYRDRQPVQVIREADCKWTTEHQLDGTWRAARVHQPSGSVLTEPMYFATDAEASAYASARREGADQLAALLHVNKKRVERVRNKVSLKKLGRPLDIDAVLENSFKNFHTKGFDYICLKRSAAYTQKLYFFDGDASKLPEVVNPHDHRYDFTTKCIAGEVENIIYEEDQERGNTFQVYKYFTPLNRGKGFKWAGETRLTEKSRESYKPGDNYFMTHDQLHTIRMVKNETVIMLGQFEDVVPVGEPTRTFAQTMPSLEGLYDRFTADEIIAKLTRLKERVPSFDLPTF